MNQLLSICTLGASATASSLVSKVDFEAIKQTQHAAWASSDFAVIGTKLQIVGESLAETADIRAGERVLDVAAGNGNVSLAAARRHARVTSTDYVSALLEKGAARATAEGLHIDFVEADAEALPFDNQSFDVVLSTFGAMYTPQHDKAAAELKRVVRSGGRIGLANWTAEGFVGQLLNLIGNYVEPAVGTQSPVLWGSELHITRLFGGQARDLQCVRRHFRFRYLSPAHWIDMFRTCHGPTRETYAALDARDQARLTADITTLLERLNVDGRGSLVVPSEYLEVVITRS